MKFADMIGYAITKKVSPSKWVEVIEERKYFGDIKSFSRRANQKDSTNDDLTLNIRISIIADPFIKQNINTIRYIKYNGSRWKIDSIDVAYPRLILNIGGLYNGPEPE